MIYGRHISDVHGIFYLNKCYYFDIDLLSTVLKVKIIEEAIRQ